MVVRGGRGGREGGRGREAWMEGAGQEWKGRN